MKKWKYFKIEEFACRHCGENHVDEASVDKLDLMREEAGFPFHINSGYRCPDHNEAVSKTGRFGPHTTGKAFDIAAMDSWTRLRIMELALAQGARRVGLAKGFVHVDFLGLSDGFPFGAWPY